MSTNDGGPAFPDPARGAESCFSNQAPMELHSGMSLRDWFAGQAMMGCWRTQRASAFQLSKLAESAYEHADAMIAAREKRNEAMTNPIPEVKDIVERLRTLCLPAATDAADEIESLRIQADVLARECAAWRKYEVDAWEFAADPPLDVTARTDANHAARALVERKP